MILKIDLVKAYKEVNWDFLRLLLVLIGMDLKVTSQIMGCISSTNFNVLVNGTPTAFFTCSRGLRQGCPLSLIFFLCIIEGLIKMISKAKCDDIIKGVKVSRFLYLTHLPFVDDVLIFGDGFFSKWARFHHIFIIFCYADGMDISIHKSYFLQNNIQEQTINFIT